MAAEQVPGSFQGEEITALAGDVGTKYKAAAEVVQKVGAFPLFWRVAWHGAASVRHVFCDSRLDMHIHFADPARAYCNPNCCWQQDCGHLCLW